MKIIRVMETTYHPKTFYTMATTPNQRALLGYMVRKGKMDSTTLGGALYLLKEIEKAELNNEIYVLRCETPYAKDIIEWVELTKMGALDKFAFSTMEIRKCIYLMKL